jgi:hypothetical protein
MWWPLSIWNFQTNLQNCIKGVYYSKILSRKKSLSKSVPTRLGTWQGNGTPEISLPGPPILNVHQSPVWVKRVLGRAFGRSPSGILSSGAVPSPPTPSIAFSVFGLILVCQGGEMFLQRVPAQRRAGTSARRRKNSVAEVVCTLPQMQGEG